MIKTTFTNFFRKKKIHRFNVRKQNDGIVLLISQSQRWLCDAERDNVLLVTHQGDISLKIKNRFSKNKIPLFEVKLSEISQLSFDDVKQIGCIAAGFFDPKSLHTLGMALSKNPVLAQIPFEFIIIPEDSYQTLIKHDWQSNTDFITPLLISGIDFFTIYEKSLLVFERKCQIRDYLDLCQLLQSLLERNVEGDIAEFGSFKGHSGYLIAQILQEFDSNKKLFLFDTFEEFPKESHGIDAFWNQTHQVNFEEVKSKFLSFKNVTFVKGDFTETFYQTNIDKLSLVYIDCDSYRGTKFLLKTIYDKYLSDNGIMILEDYGHGVLLGNRIAFHEFFDIKKDCFKFFSQFSGFQFIVKNHSSH